MRYAQPADRAPRGGQRPRRRGRLDPSGLGAPAGGALRRLRLARGAYLGHGACPDPRRSREGRLAVRLPRVEYRSLRAPREDRAGQSFRPYRAPALFLAYAPPDGGYHPALHLRSRYAEKLHFPADDGDPAHRDPAGAFRRVHGGDGPEARAHCPRAGAGHHPVFLRLLPHHRRVVSRVRRKRGHPLRHGAGKPRRRPRRARLRTGAPRAGQIHQPEPILHRSVDEAGKAHGHVLERWGHPLRHADPADRVLRRGLLRPRPDAAGRIHRVSRLLRPHDLAGAHARPDDLRDEQGRGLHRPPRVHHGRRRGKAEREGAQACAFRGHRVRPCELFL